MSITYIAAQDEVFGVVNSAWIAACEAQGLAYSPELFFPGDIAPSPASDQLYGEINYSVVKDSQASLANINSESVYEATALVTLKIYSPKSDKTAYRSAEIIADAIRNAFRQSSPSGEIWFRNQKVSAVSGTATQSQRNVVVTCIYKTIK